MTHPAPHPMATSTRRGLDLPAAGTYTAMSEPQYRLLVAAIAASSCKCGDVDCLAYIRRGDGAPLPMLNAMAKRGFVRLDKIGFKVRGAWVLDLGVRKVAELAAAEQQHAATLARANGDL